jgi:hypothetical protein
MLPKRCSHCGLVFEARPFDVVAATCRRCGGTGWPDPNAPGAPNPVKMLLPILGPLGAILAYKVFGVVGMIVVAWLALILFFRIK